MKKLSQLKSKCLIEAYQKNNFILSKFCSIFISVNPATILFSQVCTQENDAQIFFNNVIFNFNYNFWIILYSNSNNLKLHVNLLIRFKLIFFFLYQ